MAGRPEQRLNDMIYQGQQKIWADYQKEIPDDHWFYVRSCIRQNFFPGAEKMFLEICRGLLGKDFYETEHHTTCGGIAYHCDTIPQETVMTIVARQFALMTEAGYENYVASCITSFGNYIEILETWKEFPELETRIRELLWKACRREFKKPEYVAHASDLIYKYRNEIAAKAKYRLVNRLTGEPLKAVEHIGCHYAKMFPARGIGGAEYPYVLNSNPWSRTTPISFSLTARDARTSWTDGSMSSPRPKARPTEKTASVFLCSRMRSWHRWCWDTTRGISDCSCIRWP